MQKISSLLIVFLTSLSAFGQLVIPSGQFQIDESQKLIVANQLPAAGDIPSDYLVLNGKNFQFSTSPGTPSYGTHYTVTYLSDTYSLYFTELALVNLSLTNGATINNIIQDSDINGVIQVADHTGTYNQTSNMGIRIRGASSSSFPKKSYRITLRNTDYTANEDDSFLGLRTDKRWLMLAMWNEELRFNNVISHQLWRDIHTVYYQGSEPEAQSSIRTRYVEAFIDGQYRGVYAFTEDMDRKQLKLKNQVNGGELYKGEEWEGAVTFDRLPALPGSPTELWGGWELKYPDWEVASWTNLHQFTDFVKNSSDATFISQIGSAIQLDSFIDYFLFLNLTYASDNSGKNTFLARYQSGDPYFIIPWDLDGTFGYIWTGTPTNRTGEILTNNLYDRLIKLNPNDFKNRLATRWFSLRQAQFSQASLFDQFDSAKNYLENSSVYDREYQIYQNLYTSNFPYYVSSNRDNALTYIKNWTKDRLEMLDFYFNPMLTSQSGCDFKIALTASPNVVTPGANLSLSATCQGADCGGIAYQWSFNGSNVGNSSPLAITAPGNYGVYTYNLTTSLDGCPDRLNKVSFTVNDGSPEVALSFSLWTPGPVGTRTKIRDVHNGDVILIGDLPPLVNWFITIDYDQVTDASGSNYINFIDFRLNRPEYLNFGWGPENIAGSDGGPFGIFGREGGETPTVGVHQIRGQVYNGSSEVVNTVVNFVIAPAPLPVTLTYFEARGENNAAFLSWTTTEESNSDHFEIEHSRNGKNWSRIGEVTSVKNSSRPSSYSFGHAAPHPGINYYRLRMVDSDGSSSYSNLKSILFEAKNECIIYPNPVTDHMYFKKTADLKQVDIISTSGVSQSTFHQNLDQGISLKQFRPGLYLIRLSYEQGQTFTQSLIVKK